MPADQPYIDSLARNPREALQVEVKTWIDPQTPEGAAKIVRTCIALRNSGGGFLVIGFDDATGRPDAPPPPDLEARFHVDIIQGLVTKHSSEPFAVEVHWAEREASRHPIIEVPAGVKYPVAARSPIKTADGKDLVAQHRVYVRSLLSNNTPATTEATYRDWPHIIDVCFENREADIGRFLRRHLRGITPEVIRELASTLQQAQEPTAADRALTSLEDGGNRFRAHLASSDSRLADYGIHDVGFYVPVPETDARKPNTAFLNLLMSSNPKYTGWPLFIDSRSSPGANERPEIVDEAWQVFLISPSDMFGDDASFWRASPCGRFYHGRILEDDMSQAAGGPQPKTVLDFGLAILRCAEALLLGLDFAAAMKTSEDASVAYAFRWTNLKGRQLASWAQARWIRPGRTASRNEVTSEVSVPIGVARSAVADYVHVATAPLFDTFEGATFDVSLVTSFVEKLVARKY